MLYYPGMARPVPNANGRPTTAPPQGRIWPAAKHGLSGGF